MIKICFSITRLPNNNKLSDHAPETNKVMGESQLKVHCSLFSDPEVLI